MTLPAPRADLGLREGYHSAQVEVPVRLNTNESPFPPPASWEKELLAEMESIAWNRYPDRSAMALRQALGELHGLGPEWVFVANGSNEVIQCLCLAYGGPSRLAAVFEPTYALHSHIAHLTGTSVAEGSRRADLSLDLEAALSLVGSARPDITFLCSPNNPTGMAEPPETVAGLLGASPGVLVVDEAYGQFASWSAQELMGPDVPLAVTRTFSKTWSMAAARLGYLLGPPELVAHLERVALPYHVDAFKQLAGRLALRYVAEMESAVAAVVAERTRLEEAFARMGVGFWPSQANFVLFRPGARPGREVWEALLDKGVLVRDTSSWPGLGGCLRVTVGTRAENDAFLAALEASL